jgi:extradiol dioxygenase family protein
VDPILHLSLPVTDLESSRSFYVDRLGCTAGQELPGAIDVWFFGLQLTLQERPDQVLSSEQQGVRHFGVTLEPSVLARLVTRLQSESVQWISPLSTDTRGTLRGKTSAKLADPSGNVIELKAYDDPERALGMPRVESASVNNPTRAR